jgi:hypothetical protein
MLSSPAEKKRLYSLISAVKVLKKRSEKCEKAEEVEKENCKKAFQKGDVEVANIHAENVVRQRNQ